MAQNDFDQASRFAVRLAPVEFFSWAFRLPAEEFVFRRWLDTRNVPFPGGIDRTGDTVAWFDDPATYLTPWAVATEFQLEPDPLMFGRLLIYLGHLWMEVKPDPERGSRFNLGAVVINLTGTGLASRQMQWTGARLRTHLDVVERNMASEIADELLSGIETGQWSRGVLPWLPLMTGGDEQGIIERWKRLAEAEPDTRLRSEYGGLALVFADAAERKPIWAEALKGWNVKESSVVNEWRAEGQRSSSLAAVVAVLEARFGQVPAELAAVINAATDINTLQGWVPLAAKVASLDEFRKVVVG